MTGAPEASRNYLKYKNQQRTAIEGLRREFYFAKVETHVARRDGEAEPFIYLVARQRVAAGIGGDDWAVISWTSPITKDILDREVGHVTEFQAPRRRKVRIEVTSIAKYGTILPEVVDTTYVLADGSVFLEHERLLEQLGIVEAQPLPQAAPEREYEAAQEFGLSEIIELADVDQREVMHLPFHDTVLVEGPPGSGKTSIGLMRIPCLIDRQWDELGLEPEKDRPFHAVSTMRVLVLNDEMIDYLGKLIRSVGVHGVQVSTLAQFCQRISRDGRTLSGRRVTESSALTRLKSHPWALLAYWAGFRAALRAYWDRAGQLVQDSLFEAGDRYGELLARRLDRWVNSVAAIETPPDDGSGILSLDVQLEAWRRECDRLREDLTRPRDQEAATRQMETLRQRLQRVIRRFFNRRRIVREMTPHSAFQSLCSEAADRSTLDESVSEWLRQSSSRNQQVSEADYALAAWLATHVSILPAGTTRPIMGLVRPTLTHVLIDEAQDISPCHVAVVRRLLHAEGTLTLVGDLRQRVTSRGHFLKWDELDVGRVKNAVLAVNHRQSRPLGMFLAALHERLFDETPAWHASTRSGPRPRVRRQRGNAGLAEAIAEEIRNWREQIPNATVGILSLDHSRTVRTKLAKLARRIETALSDTLTDVYLAVGDGRTRHLGRTDCAVIATVVDTKGLEFDGVVVIDPRRLWRHPLMEISMLRRNRMYVAASRARQGLTLIIDDRSELVAAPIHEGLFDRVDKESL